MHLAPRIFFIIGALIPLLSYGMEQFPTEAAAHSHCPSDTVVWLNTLSGALHRKGNHWYGHTKAGAYVCLGEAATNPPGSNSQLPPSSAKWRAIGRTDAFGGGATIFIAPASIKIRHGIRSMQTLMDFKNPQALAGLEFLSSKFLKEYDCKQSRWRIVSSIMYSGHMAGGAIVQSDANADDWKLVDPGSIAADEFKIVCGKAPSQ